MKNLDVLVVGELNVDLILDDIQGFPEIGKEIIANKFTVTLGSSSAIFASNLSSLGNKVTFLGKVGNDSFSQLIISSLASKGVNTELILRSDEYNTGATIVMNYDMDRANVTFPGAMEYLEVPEVTDDILAMAKHLHVSSIFLQPLLKKDIVTLFSRAKSMGLTTSMDPQWDPEEKWDLDLMNLLPNIDVFMPNIKEFNLLTGENDLHHSLEKVRSFANNIIIKDGENGAHLWDGTELYTKPAYLNPKVSDCIGAGDSFNAGFIHPYLQAKDLKHCVETGNIIGAISTTQPGGTQAFKDKTTIEAIAKELFSFELKL